MSDYIGPNEIVEYMPISVSSAYRIIRQLNDELKNEGYLTISGKVPRNYFMQRFNLKSKEKDAS